MKVAVGSDHAGFILKEEITRFLKEQGVDYTDFGAHSPERSDYPDVGLEVAEAVASGDFDRGILVCFTGVGMSIVANKVPGIRAALCADRECAVLTREHNDSNILTLGSRITSAHTARGVVDTWLSTTYPGEDRHARRVQKITEIDRKYNGGGR